MRVRHIPFLKYRNNDTLRPRLWESILLNNLRIKGNISSLKLIKYSLINKSSLINKYIPCDLSLFSLSIASRISFSLITLSSSSNMVSPLYLRTTGVRFQVVRENQGVYWLRTRYGFGFLNYL